VLAGGGAGQSRMTDRGTISGLRIADCGVRIENRVIGTN
jgi:hypothetical protein